jgi:hypothetical protein
VKNVKRVKRDEKREKWWKVKGDEMVLFAEEALVPHKLVILTKNNR